MTNPDGMSEFLRRMIEEASGAASSPEPIKEPSANALIGANALRDMYLGLVKSGFTDDQAFELLKELIQVSVPGGLGG